MKDKTNPLIRFGKFNGRLLRDLPDWYLSFVYGSYSKFRKVAEAELRRRGFDDDELGHFRTKYPHLGREPGKKALPPGSVPVVRSPVAKPKRSNEKRRQKRLEEMLRLTKEKIRRELGEK